MKFPNTAALNKLWMVKQGREPQLLNTVCVKKVTWSCDSKTVVILEGLLQKDAFLLEIMRPGTNFEIRSGKRGDEIIYDKSDEVMFFGGCDIVENWTDNVTIRDSDDDHETKLYAKMICDTAVICDS